MEGQRKEYEVTKLEQNAVSLIRTSQNKGANAGDEFREKRVEWKRANKQIVEKLHYSSQHEASTSFNLCGVVDEYSSKNHLITVSRLSKFISSAAFSRTLDMSILI